jgi:DNA invertase Pin-like site-specific DNA recombinase
MNSSVIDKTATAYSYIRFSRTMQKLGRSEDRQMEQCVAWCEKHGVTLSEDTFLDQGKSGYTGDHVGPNGQLRRFLDLVETGKIAHGSYLVVESLDRLGREDINDALERFLGILNAGIRIVTLMDDKVYCKPFTMADVLTSVVIMERANDESRNKSGRSKDNWRQAFAKAREHKQPVGKQVAMWLKLEEEDLGGGVNRKKYVKNPERVSVVERIFSECAAGHGFVAIAKHLNADSIPAFRGGTWCPSSVKEILGNRCVLGEWKPKDGGGVIEDYFPKVIEPAVWDAAQVAMKARRGGTYTRQTPNFQIWQQVGMCYDCGATLNLVTKGPKQHKYLACSSKRKLPCNNPGNVRADLSEQVYKEILVKVGALGLIQSDAGEIMQKLTSVDAAIIRKQDELKQHQQAIEDYGPSPTFYQLIATADAAIKELESERTKLQQQHTAEVLTQNDKTWLLENLPLTERDERQRANALLRRLDVKVQIKGGKEPVFTCLQKGKPFLTIFPHDTGMVVIPLTQEQRKRFKEQDVKGQDLAKLDAWIYEKLGVGTLPYLRSRKAETENKT